MNGAPVGLIAIGASLGGLQALEYLLSRLPADMPPIAIVQHRRADEDSRLTELLGAHSTLPVREPDDKDRLERATVYVAPSDYHLLVEGTHFALSTEGTVRHARPSIDVLFETSARAYGPRVLAVALTSSSDDGAAGAVAIRRAGGRVVVQNPKTAHSPILPLAVLDRTRADAVLDLEQIPAWLARACARVLTA